MMTFIFDTYHLQCCSQKKMITFFLKIILKEFF